MDTAQMEADSSTHLAAHPPLIVEVLTSSLAGKRFAYTATALADGIGIGRAPGCKLRFDASRDLKVSGKHAILEKRRDGLYIRDAGSANGVYANGKRVSDDGLRVYDGTHISLGKEGALMRLVIPDEPAPKEDPEVTGPIEFSLDKDRVGFAPAAGPGATTFTRDETAKEETDQEPAPKAEEKGGCFGLFLLGFVVIAAIVAASV